jgi:hypothetical protein
MIAPFIRALRGTRAPAFPCSHQPKGPLLRARDALLSAWRQTFPDENRDSNQKFEARRQEALRRIEEQERISKFSD